MTGTSSHIGLTIRPAQLADAGELLTVQRAAFLADAQIYNNAFLPSLTQSLDDLTALIANATSVVLVAHLEHRLVGSVRAEIIGSSANIGRLMTVPDLQGWGIGSQLMAAIEDAVGAVEYFELTTGARSISNIALYTKLGYTTTSLESASGLETVTMTKLARA